MVRYSKEAAVADKTCKARAESLRTHYKKMREVGHAVQGMNLKKAQKYLEDVLEFKRAVAFKRYTGGCGRHAQGKNIKAPGSQCGWPIKSTKFMLDLLKNVEANGEMRGLDVDQLVITHMQVNRAPKMRRRTYRAHGRINAYMSNPCHVELMCTERDPSGVKKESDKPSTVTFYSRKRVAQLRRKNILPVGGGVEAEDMEQ